MIKIFQEIKWAWQRVFRGWDDRVIWQIDSYLDEMIPAWLTQFKKYPGGIPDSFVTGETDEDFQIGMKNYLKMIDEIILGFESHKKIEEECLWIDDPLYHQYRKNFERGFELFFKYYESLWN